MTYEQSVQKEMSGFLRTHKKLVGGEFSLVSLLESLGHDAKDWGRLALDEIYQHWAKEYESRGKDEKIAAKLAHQVAGHRAGYMLFKTLQQEHKGSFEIVGRKQAGRFGGPMHYRWITS